MQGKPRLVVTFIVLTKNGNVNRCQKKVFMKNQELIEKYKEKYGMPSNEAAAATLGIAASHLSAYVNDKRPMPIAMKFRLLQHIGFAGNIEKVAACFVDIEEHFSLMSADQNRIDALSKNQSDVHDKYVNQKEIDRINKLKIERQLSNKEVAVFLETSEEQIKAVLSGDEVLSKLSKAMLFIANGGTDLITGVLDLLPIKESTKAAWLEASNRKIVKNLDSRIK